MTKEALRLTILDFLNKSKGWVFGGPIEDHIAQNTIHKASSAARKCRNMAEDGLIERTEEKIDGKNCVKYRITQAGKEYLYSNIDPKAAEFLREFGPKQEIKSEDTNLGMRPLFG